MIAKTHRLRLLLILCLGATAADAQRIYRWSDDQGVVHYGPIPRPGATPLDLRSTPRPRPRTVTAVLDGDTVELDGGERVRLLGVNAPEIAHRSHPAEPGGPEAHRFLAGLLQGRRVRLEYGAGKRDPYGRTLAHLFDEHGGNINLSLLRAGHAHVSVHPPDFGHLDEYFRAEAEARRHRAGIWALERYQVQPASRAADLRNSHRLLRGRVRRVEKGKNGWALYLPGQLRVVIGNGDLQRFTTRGIHPSGLLHREIVVAGWVRQRKGHPYLAVHHPGQIEIH
jgi:micrococcal nuclease